MRKPGISKYAFVLALYRLVFEAIIGDLISTRALSAINIRAAKKCALPAVPLILSVLRKRLIAGSKTDVCLSRYVE
jgi:hypothetical protein